MHSCTQFGYTSQQIGDILNGFDISEFNEQFYFEWKTINWNYIFNDQYIEFLKKCIEKDDEDDYVSFNFKYLILDELQLS